LFKEELLLIVETVPLDSIVLKELELLKNVLKVSIALPE
jgi:hypothetical protein